MSRAAPLRRRAEAGFVLTDVIVALALSAMAVSIGLASLEVMRRAGVRADTEQARNESLILLQETLQRVVSTYQANTEPEAISFIGSERGFSFLCAPLPGRESAPVVITHVALTAEARLAIWREPFEPGANASQWPQPIGEPDWLSTFPTPERAKSAIGLAGFSYILSNGERLEQIEQANPGAAPPLSAAAIPVISAQTALADAAPPRLAAILVRFDDGPRAPLSYVLPVPPVLAPVAATAELAPPPEAAP